MSSTIPHLTSTRRPKYSGNDIDEVKENLNESFLSKSDAIFVEIPMLRHTSGLKLIAIQQGGVITQTQGKYAMLNGILWKEA